MYSLNSECVKYRPIRVITGKVAIKNRSRKRDVFCHGVVKNANGRKVRNVVYRNVAFYPADQEPPPNDGVPTGPGYQDPVPGYPGRMSSTPRVHLRTLPGAFHDVDPKTLAGELATFLAA